MVRKIRYLSGIKILLILFSLAIITLAWVEIRTVETGLEVRFLNRDGVPILIILPEGQQDLPGVIIAHGFSGSKQLMLGYGYTFAKAGYGILLLDFSGHGANQVPMDTGNDVLQANISTAYLTLINQPEIDPEKVALLGHSMGSGAVMRAGILNPERYQAVIAVSPTSAEISPTLPKNLFLQAGQYESGFIDNAKLLLEQAGGVNEEFANGLGRKFEIIPGVEHITILFSNTSHRLALDWLNAVFDIKIDHLYRDFRMLWFGVNLFGWLVLILALSPLLKKISKGINKPSRIGKEKWVGLLVAPFLSSGLLWVMGKIFDASRFGGFLVGGTLGLWFFFLGVIWLLVSWNWSSPTVRNILAGLVLFGLLWVGFGLMSQYVWLPWFANPTRILKWPWLVIAVFPWQFAAAQIQIGEPWIKRIGWWLFQCTILIPGLIAAVFFVPGLFFMTLLIPALPLVFGVLAIGNAAFENPWATALGNAMFFAWCIIVLFPTV